MTKADPASASSSAMAALAAIRKGDVGVAALTSHFLDRIEKANGRFHALRQVMAEDAMATAEALDSRIRAGQALPALAGLPVVIKENCDTAGAVCSAGLSFRNDHRPNVDSAITARLRSMGAVVLGMAVSDPGAFGVRTAEVTHPLDASLTVGGSSGGSAAALAAGFCLGAIGTDTGGSIRLPSACCGTVGLKPSFGALPMDGIFPLVRSLDHVGPMARSVQDVSLLWHALSGRKAQPASPPRRIGYDPAWIECADAPIREASMRALARLRERGVVPTEIVLPDLDDVVAMHGRIFLVEAAAYHCAHHSRHLSAYPPFVQGWFAAAREMSAGDYIDACTKRVAMTRVVSERFPDVDAILAPTLLVARPGKWAETVSIAGESHDFIMGLVRATCLFDHTGHPSIALPIAGGDPLTSSLQVIGPHGGEDVVLNIASMLEDRGASDVL